MVSTVPQTRLDHLQHGVNLSHWFWQGYIGDPITTIQQYITEEDILLLQQLGVDHVRLPVDVAYVIDWNHPTQLNEQMLALLDEAIQMLHAHNLAVMVTPFGEIDQKVVDLTALDDVTAFWHHFASHLSTFDPELTMLEVANEPIADPAHWQSIQEHLIQTIRQVAPEHTIITATSLKHGSGEQDWGVIQALTETTPSEDDNVIYNLHFYEPFQFTHQGAEWGDPVSAMLTDIPYPSSPEAVAEIAARLEEEMTDPAYHWVPDWIRQYGADGWNASMLEKVIAPAAQWARTHDVPLHFNEFGVYQLGGADPQQRIDYLLDLRVVMQEQGISWTAWDYGAGFGIVDKTTGSPVLDDLAADALGFNTLLTGEVNEHIGTQQADILKGGSANDIIQGDNGNDWIVGREGADLLMGGRGADHYQFHSGDGQDIVSEYGGGENQSIEDRLIMADVRTTQEMTLERQANHLSISYGNDDEVLVFNHFDPANTNRRVELLELGSGEVYALSHELPLLYEINRSTAHASSPSHSPTENDHWNLGAIINGPQKGEIAETSEAQQSDKTYVIVEGSDRNDRLRGGNDDEWLIGGGGRDRLVGGNGDDRLEGGIGNDRLRGGDGADVFVFSPDDHGHDRILDFNHQEDKIDIQAFETDYETIERMIVSRGRSVHLILNDVRVTVQGEAWLEPDSFLF